MYKRVNDLRGGYKKKERFLRDDDGSLITTSGELTKKWEIQESQDCEEPTLEEIKLQINMLKNNKSPGEDDIQSELLKEGGEEMVVWLWKVIHEVWTTEKMPKKWKTADKLIKLVGISILETFVKVKVGNTNSDPILVKSGLRQGDAVSPILFNIVVEKVVREMNITPQEGVKFQE
ncbi:ribosome biogenesis protein TSR3 isoform X1, partial [Aphis craccivora]